MYVCGKMWSKTVKKLVDRPRKVAYTVTEEGVFYFCFIFPASVPLPLAILTNLVVTVAMKQVSDPGLANPGQRLKWYVLFRSRARVKPSLRLTFEERSVLFLLGGLWFRNLLCGEGLFAFLENEPSSLLRRVSRDGMYRHILFYYALFYWVLYILQLFFNKLKVCGNSCVVRWWLAFFSN